jgi:hypothetical protein
MATLWGSRAEVRNRAPLPQRVCPDSADLCTGVRARGGQVYARYWDCEANKHKKRRVKLFWVQCTAGAPCSTSTLQLHAQNS